MISFWPDALQASSLTHTLGATGRLAPEAYQTLEGLQAKARSILYKKQYSTYTSGQCSSRSRCKAHPTPKHNSTFSRLVDRQELFCSIDAGHII